MNPESFQQVLGQLGEIHFLQEGAGGTTEAAFIAQYDRSLLSRLDTVRSGGEETACRLDLAADEKRFFQDWTTILPTRRSSRFGTGKIVQEAIDGLMSLGSKPTKKEAVPILRTVHREFQFAGTQFRYD